MQTTAEAAAKALLKAYQRRVVQKKGDEYTKLKQTKAEK